MRKDTTRTIIRSAIDCTSYYEATQKIIAWAEKSKSSYVCISNVHMVMEAFDDLDYQHIVNEADLVTPDGMPLVWAMRLLGISAQERVYGPTLTLHVCNSAATNAIPIALYGGSEKSLSDFCSFLLKKYPRIRIVCKIAPPYRELTQIENINYTHQIVASGAKIIFVGIGCPKQERWMAAHKKLIPGVMIGVGAAFDFHSGRIRQAPQLMQKLGLEWFFRLCMEPRRLFKRYFKHNPRFIYFFIIQLIKEKFSK